VVRSILQQRAVVGDDALHSTSLTVTVRHLWRTERLRGFYRGIVPHILRSTPQASITLVAYEYIHRVIVREK
jgi:solute carrier family 25 folate transporter 32